MSLGVQLTEQQKKELAILQKELSEHPPKPQLQGECAGCGRGIPVGYLATVTAWKKVLHNGLAMSVADEMYCQRCAAGIEGRPHVRKPRTVKNEPVVEEGLSVKEIAQRLFQACLPRQKYSPAKLAEAAKVPYSKLVDKILQKLAEKGKVKAEGSKWLRA